MGFSLGSLTKGVSNVFNGVGSTLNSLTGVTSSSNQAFKQSKYLANLSYQQQKEFAQNAHQWEMQDLLKSGLNPALTTQSSSAGAIASEGQIGNSGYTGTSAGASPFAIIDAINGTRTTNASTTEMKAGAELQKAQAIQIIEMLPISKREKEAYIKKIEADTKFTNERARGYSESSSETESDTIGTNTGFRIAGSGMDKGVNKTKTRQKSSARTY